MSHDELPPGSQPPHSDADRAATPERETSPDAPPAAKPRRRRAKAAEPEAASNPEPLVAAKPARSTRSRRKPDVSAPPEETEAPPSPPVENAPVASETETAVPAETGAKPARRRATGRRNKTATSTPDTQSVETTPAVEAVAPPETPPAPAAETPDATAKPRRRNTRGRKTTPPAEPVAAAETIEAAPAVPETQTTPSSETEGEPTAKRKGRPRSRRRGRNAEEAVAETETPLAETAPEAIASPAETAENEAASQETPTETTRTRRTRREGRGRRGRGKAVQEVGEAVAAEEVPVAKAEPVEPPVDLTIGAHLIFRNGLPEIRIQNVAYPPLLFFGNVEGERNRQRVIAETRRAARAGIHLHSTLIELPCPMAENSDALDEIDNRLRALLDADPDGFVMPRIVFVPARGWKRQYPTEIATYADGTTGDPSITSERFWQEAEHSLAALVAHFNTHVWGERIFGYHLERGEWFQPADLGYDRSTANRDAFRDWLREKYHNSLVGLRAAWYDGEVQFHTAEIPTPPAKPNPLLAFYEPRRDRRSIDFNEFTSESTAKRLIALAKAIKKATKNQALVSVCYGYTFEFGHPFSGHLALSTLLASPALDLICGPPSYRDRKPGGAASLPAPVDSLPLHGKLWLSEDDTRTWLAPAQQDADDFNPRLNDRFATEQAQARAMGRALSRATGIGWMDLWGEGWLDDDGIWEQFGAFTARYRAFLQKQEQDEVPEVIFLFDEKSLLHVQRGEAFFRRITNGLRDTFQRSGASFGVYLQSDILTESFPTNAKLYVFLDPYRLTSAQRAAVKEKLQRDNKTLAWLYAPGVCEQYPGVSGAMEETAHGATGISLRQQAWNSEVGSRIIEPYHVVTERISQRELGTRERLNPSFFVEDSDAFVLAEYQGSGLPSLAVRNFGTWKSVFVGDPSLPLELLRGICRYAGVHLWLTQGEDVVSAGNGWVTIHASKDGQRTLRLPGPTGLYDVTEGRLIADEAREYRFFLRAGMTRTFCVGPTEHFVTLGLPNASLPGEGRARLVLDAPPDARRETGSAARPRNSDLETLQAVLTVSVDDLEGMDEADLETLEGAAEPDEEPGEADGTEEAASGEMMAGGRRRRRRGGRGRWRKRSTEGNGPAPEGPPSPPPGE